MDPDYVDVPARRMRSLCATCGGSGVVVRPFTVALPCALARHDQQASPCLDCEPTDPDHASTGRVPLEDGPGAKLRRVDRVKLPGDDWPQLRPR